MAYEVYSFLCRNREHGEMEYKGEGDYECPFCGMTYHDYEYDDNGESESEGLSVHDAALIWLSHGKDEDYDFGYSEEELENAL